MNRLVKKLLALWLCVLLLQPLNAHSSDWFETWGDVFQFLPLMAGAYSLARQDYEGLAQLALGTGTTLAITKPSKYTFVGISQANENAAGISRRPNNGGFDGFPSGHTSSAFSAAGYMQKRYGWKFGLPTTLLATSVGISRVVSEHHTVLQVLVGALLGYGVSYLFAKRLENIVLDVGVHSEPISLGYENIVYKVGFSYRF